MNRKSIKRRAKYLTTLSSSSLPVSLHSLDTNAHTHSWIIKQCQTWLSGTILWQDLTKMVTRYFVHFCTMTVHVSAGHESAHPNNRMFQRRHGLRDTAWGKGWWAVELSTRNVRSLIMFGLCEKLLARRKGRSLTSIESAMKNISWQEMVSTQLLLHPDPKSIMDNHVTRRETWHSF